MRHTSRRQVICTTCRESINCYPRACKVIGGQTTIQQTRVTTGVDDEDVGRGSSRDLIASVDMDGNEMLGGSFEEQALAELGHVQHELLHHLQHVTHQDIALQLPKRIWEHLCHTILGQFRSRFSSKVHPQCMSLRTTNTSATMPIVASGFCVSTRTFWANVACEVCA